MKTDKIDNEVKPVSRTYTNKEFENKGTEITDTGKKTGTAKTRILGILKANNCPLTQSDIAHSTKDSDKELSSIHVRNVLMGNSPEKFPNSPVGKGLVKRLQMPDSLYYYRITNTGKDYLKDLTE